jgi:hypothetical protein
MGMEKKTMIDLVKRELSHIPEWPFRQRLLRMNYWNARMNSLGRKAEEPDDPKEVLKRAIASCERVERGPYEYDAEFFEAESARLAAEKGGPALPFQAVLKIALRPWAHYPADWAKALSGSLATIHRTMWDRSPEVLPSGERIVEVRLDTYGVNPRDASSSAESLLRRHLPLAGLMEGDYDVTVTLTNRLDHPWMPE